MNHLGFLVIPFVFAALLGFRVASADESGLETTRVAVFNSGVAFFEREATVSGDARAELRFRTEQINDILKSLIVQDLDGGSVGVVSYASRDPVEKTLKSFGVDLTGKPTLGELLNQLRGEPVEISGPRNLRGTIVGVEEQRKQTENGVIERELLNLLTESGLQLVPIDELQGIQLVNPTVREELQMALETLATSHDADKKSVELNFNGQGERRVRVSYLLEAPIWKTTYRLALTSDRKPFMQGWATVDNATENDWNDVRLSLISGRPISFRMDLYTPIYVPRPEVELELYASLKPPEYEADMEESQTQLFARRRGGGVAGRAMAPAAPAAAAEAYADKDAAGLALEGVGVEAAASGQEAGELFEYVIRTPVSIARQNSAMLPIVNEEVEAEKVSVFNAQTHGKFPLNGLYLTNTTGLHLMQGPVTVFDDNLYAGDAKLPDLNPGEKRLIAYALDLAVEVNVERKDVPTTSVSLRIAKGTLWHKVKYVDERNYIVRNKAERARTMILEQPYAAEWNLVEPSEPFEKTRDTLRFKLQAPAGKTVSQKVVLEQVTQQSVALTNLSIDNIQMYLRNPVITDAVRKALQEVIRLRSALDEASRTRARLEQELNETVQEQGRIRQNLQTLDRNTDVYQRQLKKFDELETQIEQKRADLKQARGEEESRRKALEDYLLSLDVE